MKNKAMLLIIILALVAVVLGIMIFLQKPKPTTQKPAATEPIPNKMYLTDEDVLVFPGPNAPQQVRDRHNAFVDKLAQRAPYLDLTECKPEPLVLALTQGEDLVIRNRDTEKDYVFFWGDITSTVPAGKSITVSANELGAGVGNLGYACYEADITPPGIGTVGVIRVQAAQ